MRKVKLLAAIVAMTVAAVAIGLWLVRDQPRRIVQSALAERLDAEVSVGSLHVEGLSEVRLGEVVIRMHAAPGLREIRIAEIVARGAVGDMAGGRFQSLRMAGVEVVVDPAAGAVWPTAGGPQMNPEVARLEIAAGRLTLLSPDGDSDIDFTADLNDLGIVPTGTVTFTGDRLQLDPLLRLAGLEAPDSAAAHSRRRPCRRASSGRGRTAVRTQCRCRPDLVGGPAGRCRGAARGYRGRGGTGCLPRRAGAVAAVGR